MPDTALQTAGYPVFYGYGRRKGIPGTEGTGNCQKETALTQTTIPAYTKIGAILHP
jgi:hypothetical protein